MATGFDPEVAIESLAEGSGITLEPVGQRGVTPDVTCKASRSNARVVRISLDLASRDRPLRDRAVGEQDRIPRVLPALVDEAFGRARLVLEVAVPVAVAVPLDPFQGPQCRRFQTADEIA